MHEKTYAELLRDPRWQKRKTEILVRDNFTCQCCGCTDKTLHVHHKYYDGRKPWEYEDDALVTLCEDCHNDEHKQSMPRVGEVYLFEHSDYYNYMVCYGVNYVYKSVYVFGYDDGNSDDAIYIESVPMEYFSNKYKRIRDFWSGLGKDVYIPKLLLNMIVKIHNKESFEGKISFIPNGFPFSKDNVVNFLRDKIDLVIQSEENLYSHFKRVVGNEKL